jgi:drug/metabolite transporter (DMT)-like permease
VAVDVGTIALTVLALIAFASNSLLTRLALGAGEIDAATFTSVRLVAGALVLALLVRVQAGTWTSVRSRGAGGPVALIAYAVPFSFAYLRIGAAVGALVLFGVVQLTMIAYGLIRGERPDGVTWLGLLLATAGLLMLTLPSASRPDPVGLLLMAVAGVAWGAYSLVGRTAPEPIASNAWSFLWSAPLAVLVNVALSSAAFAGGRGIVLAAISGAITSGLGYAVWYRALPRLSVAQAAVAQLSVPVIAALGAAVLLGEMLTVRFAMSGAAILGGVGLVLSARSRRPTPSRTAGPRSPQARAR